MTEQEWLLGRDPEPLRDFISIEEHDRKLRLYCSACCRRVWAELPDERSRQAVLIAEQYADGLVDEYILSLGSNAACDVWNESRSLEGIQNGNPLPYCAAAYNAAVTLAWWGGAPSLAPPDRIIRAAVPDPDAEAAAQLHLLREIFGNPFQPAAFEDAWRTTTAFAIAKAMYESRDFAAMSLLADALQDAGCEHAGILDHCRGPGPHVKGCWVVDLVLGKE